MTERPLTRMERRGITLRAESAAFRGDHESARVLFARVGITYLPAHLLNLNALDR